MRALLPRRWVAVLLVGVLGALLSLAGRNGYYQKYKDFLLLLAYWVAPWAGIVCADFFLRRDAGRFDVGRLYDRRRALGPGLGAWAVAVAVSIPFFNQALYVGPVARALPQLGDVSHYVSFVVAGALYRLWSGSVRRHPRRSAS